MENCIFNNLIHLKSVSPNAIYRAETKSGNHLVIINIYFIAMTDFIHLFIFKLISFCHAQIAGYRMMNNINDFVLEKEKRFYQTNIYLVQFG